MQIFLDTEQRLRRGDDLGFVSAREVFEDSIKNLCPWHLELGRVKAQTNRRSIGKADHEYLRWSGDVIFRLSMPGVFLEGSKIRFVADNDTYSPELFVKDINRHQIEEILNDLEPISTHGGVTVEGQRMAAGSLYRVMFNELGDAPSLEWMMSASAVSITACETEEATTGAGGRWVYDIWLPDTPNIEWYLAEKDDVTAIEVAPVGPSFSGNGAQIDRISIDPTASGYYVLQVPGDTPTDPIPVFASPQVIMDELNKVSLGTYSTARISGLNTIDLIHSSLGIQSPITVDDIFTSVADIRTATIAHSDILADNKLSGGGPIKIEILNQTVTETNNESATTTEILYSAEI